MGFWRRAFWKSFGIAVRRSPHDRRARIFLLKVSAAAAYLILYFSYVFIPPLRAAGGGGTQFAFYGVLLVAGFVAFRALRKSHARDDQLLNFSLRAVEEKGTLSSANRSYLRKRVKVVASLLGRGGSEIRIADGRLGNLLSRTTENDRLRQAELWDELEPIELSLMSKPEGAWSVQERDGVIAWSEQLRLLRWILGVDSELTPLEHFPRPDVRLAGDLYHLDPKLASNVGVWDVRSERDKSATYVNRLFAELERRNLLPASVADRRSPDDLQAEPLGNSTDLLAGVKTIADLDEQALRLMTAVSLARMQYAAWLVEYLSSDTTMSFAEWLSSHSN